MDRQYSCKKCPKSFKLKNHLRKHEISCTGFQSYIKCEDCKGIFKSERTLKVHRVKCKPDKNYKCGRCDEIFEFYTQLLKHRIKNHKTVQCKICEFESHSSNLKRHMQKKHRVDLSVVKAVQEKNMKYKCDNCAKCFYDKSTLNRHMKKHTYQCDRCENVFRNTSSLDEHKMSHNTVDAFEEDACKKCGESKDNLRILQETLEAKLLDLELEVSKKNAIINKLKEENKSLQKFKSWSSSLEKELARLNRGIDVDEKESCMEATDLFKDEIKIEESSVCSVRESVDAPDETIELTSSFLRELASNTTDESLDLEENVAQSHTEISKSYKVTSFERKSQDSLNYIDKSIAANDDVIKTLSDDNDENSLTSDSEDDLLETIYVEHPSEESVKSFISLKSFSSLCAKYDNISRRDQEKRPSKRQKLSEFFQ